MNLSILLTSYQSLIVSIYLSIYVSSKFYRSIYRSIWLWYNSFIVFFIAFLSNILSFYLFIYSKSFPVYVSVCLCQFGIGLVTCVALFIYFSFPCLRDTDIVFDHFCVPMPREIGSTFVEGRPLPQTLPAPLTYRSII